MATLQVRDIDDRLYAFLKTSAKIQNRSLSQEVITIIQNHLNSVQQSGSNATLEFLSLESTWKDDRNAEDIIAEIKTARETSNRFGAESGIFD